MIEDPATVDVSGAGVDATRHAAARTSNVEALAVLGRLLAQDPEEQREQWEQFRDIIDAERPPEQRLFR